jgi:hypothetical protein
VRLSEFKRQRRLVGFYLSAHTSIAERMRRRHRILLAAIIVLSVLATALAFADPDRHIDFFVNASLPTWAGILSASVFALALLDLLFGWERIAAEHEEAVRRLDPLAALYRGIEPDSSGTVNTGQIDLEGEYWRVVETIVRIPNREFGRLKGQHLHKIEVSKALDHSQSAFPRVISAKLHLKDTRRFLRECHDPPPPPGPDAAIKEIPDPDEDPPSPNAPR